MARKRRKAEEIVNKIRQADIELGKGDRYPTTEPPLMRFRRS